MLPDYKFSIRPLIVVGLVAGMSVACNKIVQIQAPPTQIAASTAFADNATAASVLTGIYDQIQGNGAFAGGLQSLTLLGGLSADELQLYSSTGFSANDVGYYKNAVPNSSTLLWSEPYKYIYDANAAIEGLKDSTAGVSASVRQQLTGEAKFIRAFFYFYLTNLFGDVPLATTTSYTVNNNLPRTPKAQVYQQIVADLKDAQNSLSPDFLSTDAVTVTVDRVRPTKWAATALLARVYLYTGDWASAQAQATTVINNTGSFSILANLNSVFLKNSREAIWELPPVIPGENTLDGQTFILTTAPNSIRPVALSSELVNAFEPGDKRDTVWVGNITRVGKTYYYPHKYKAGFVPGSTPTEYLMMLRLSEQYLIRAEAEAQQNDTADARKDVDVIRNRAGLPNSTVAADKDSLLAAILHERQVEFFAEWGHRWLDLKRTGTIDAVMPAVDAIKGGTWASYKQLFPIPLSDMQKDPQLTPQNSGY